MFHIILEMQQEYSHASGSLEPVHPGTAVIKPLKVTGLFKIDLFFGHDFPIDGMTLPIGLLDRKFFKHSDIGESVCFFNGSCKESFRCSDEEICCHNDRKRG